MIVPYNEVVTFVGRQILKEINISALSMFSQRSLINSKCKCQRSEIYKPGFSGEIQTRELFESHLYLVAYQRNPANKGNRQEVAFEPRVWCCINQEKCSRIKGIVCCVKSCCKFQGGTKPKETIKFSKIKDIEDIYKYCFRNFV